MPAIQSLVLTGAANSGKGTPLSAAADSFNKTNGVTFTIGCFVKFNATPGAGLQAIMGKWQQPTEANQEYLIYANSGNITFVAQGTGGQYSAPSASSIVGGVWYSVVGIVDLPASHGYIYINGTQSASGLGPGDLFSTAVDFRIGSAVSDETWALDGEVAMVFKYTGRVADADIVWLHNGGLGRSKDEILARSGLTTPDYLITFDDAGTLGTDSSAHAVTLSLPAGITTPPTQGLGPGAPTAATLTGPTSGTTGSDSAAFNVTLNAPAPVGGIAIALTGGGSGTYTGANISVTTLTIPAGQTGTGSAGNFTYNKATSGTIAIGATAAGITFSGSPISYTATGGTTVTGVTVTPNPATVAGATTQAFAAVVAGTGGPSQSVTWSVDIGSINGSGVYTAPAATGSAQHPTVTATSVQDTSKSGTAAVTVPSNVTPAISPGSITINLGATTTLVASGFTGGAVTWSSSLTSHVSVGSTGLCTGIGTGTSTITATGVANTAQIATSVVTVPAVTLAVSPNSATVVAGSTRQITPTVTGAANTAVTYASADTSIATVSGSGLVTAVAVGSVTITVTLTVNGTTAPCVITVTAAPPAEDLGDQVVQDYPTPSLSTLYFVIVNATGSGPRFWNGDAYEAPSSAHWTDYAIALSDPSGCGFYLGTIPTDLPHNAILSIYSYRRIGDTPSPADTPIGAQLDAFWDGVSLLDASTLSTVYQPIKSATNASVTLNDYDADAPAGLRIETVAGTGRYQLRTLGVKSSSQTFAIDPPWTVTPDATTYYALFVPDSVTIDDTGGGGGGGTTDGVIVATGIVAASPIPTAQRFTATGLPSGLVTGDLVGQPLKFQSGPRTTATRRIATDVVTGSSHEITLSDPFGAPPVAGNTFIVG